MMRDSMRGLVVRGLTLLLFLSSPLWGPIFGVTLLVGRWYNYLHDMVNDWL